MAESRRRLLILCMGWLLLAGHAMAAAQVSHPPRLLSIADLQRLKRKPCTFITVWATWCSICMREMPDLVTWLAKQKRVHPVILDVGEPYLQEQIAKKWRVLLEAPFPTYLKPLGNDAAYFRAIDPAYDRTLPFSVLYDGGKRKRFWRGALDRSRMEREMGPLCK